jgi:hypothetical protein
MGMARSTFNNGDQIWVTWLALLTALSVDTRFGAQRKKQLAADVVTANANAALGGVTPALIGRSLEALRDILLSKQA